MSAVTVSAERTTRSVRVMLADDVDDIRRLVGMGLARAGHYEIVGEAPDGAETLRMAAELLPDVLVLDVAMPKLDGFEVLERIGEVAPECRVVVLSGFGADLIRQRALELGARACVEKGGGLIAITKAVDEACADLIAPAHGLPIGEPEPVAGSLAVQDGDAPGDFVAYVVHELSTPIAVVRGFAETLRDLGLPDDEAVRTAVEAIIRNADNLNELLQRFREARAVEVGSLNLDLHPVELAAFVRETVADLAAAVSPHPVSVSADASVAVYLDPVRIRQALTNLVGNAAKYSPDRAPIEVVVDTGATCALVTVTDHGPGIAPELRDKVFDRFTRVDLSQKGTGLGLYIAHGIARAHGGDLTVRDAPEGGCSFELTLPVDTDA